MLEPIFFDRDAQIVAQDLLGKVIFHRHNDLWLAAKIIETEAYYLNDKASHASLGYTEKRKALFMPAGTIYMYYARGKDSLNVSCRGEGNAVLIKSAVIYEGVDHLPQMLVAMQANQLIKPGQKPRPIHRLCSGQTLLCQALALKVKHWDQQCFDRERFYLADVDYRPQKILQTTRLGIPSGRDEHLPYRFIDYAHASQCSKNPLSGREKSKFYEEISSHSFI